MSLEETQPSADLFGCDNPPLSLSNLTKLFYGFNISTANSCVFISCYITSFGLTYTATYRGLRETVIEILKRSVFYSIWATGKGALHVTMNVRSSNDSRRKSKIVIGTV